MRNGAKNISWYRGPFVPENTNFDDSNNIKFSSSDTALYYDTNTGLLDVSIAAAWELGKISALKSQEFTKAMIEWNNNPFLNTNNEKTTLPNKTDVLNWIQNSEKSKTDLKEKNTFQSYKPFPGIVKVFLKELAELKSVPLSYLIPDKKYITSTSGNENCLTLFNIHQKWIFAMLDGAVSLTGLRSLDTKTQVESIIESVYGNKACTGFLLHSKLVSNWRGIEIKTFNNHKTLLKNPIRFERITPSIFLGIFKDEISKIAIKQPYEGLHFGIKEKSNSSGTFEKALKNKLGQINESDKIEIKADEILKGNQVLSIEKITEQIKLHTNNCSSADFAYQMVDCPMEGFFTINFTS